MLTEDLSLPAAIHSIARYEPSVKHTEGFLFAFVSFARGPTGGVEGESERTERAERGEQGGTFLMEKVYPKKQGRGRVHGRIPVDIIESRKELERNARAAAGSWIANLSKWDLYMTLTYDPRRARFSQAPSMWASRRHMAGWLAKVDKSFGRNVCSVSSLEYQQNGWPHWHGLIAAGGVSQAEFKMSSELWYNAYGYAKFVRIGYSDRAGVSDYVAKYITKDSGDVLFYGPLGDLQQLPMEGRP